MNPYLKRGAQAYQKASVTTYDQGTLIIMMYEGAIKFLKQSKIKIEKRELENSHNLIMKAKAIISELLNTLRVEESGEIGKGLQQLYNYIYNLLIEANMKKDINKINESIKLLENLLDGWRIIAKKNRVENALHSSDKVSQLNNSRI